MKIGETMTIIMKVECVESSETNWCCGCILEHVPCTDNPFGECNPLYREDGKNVIFKEIKN